MQLILDRRALLVAAAILVAGGGGAARAEHHGNVKVTYFVEPATTQRLHVVHPQAKVSLDAGRYFTFRLGYDADIVTGATPRTYSKVDVVSAATTFFDARHAFHAGLDYHTGPVTLSAGYSYAFESDYRSHVIEAGARVDLNERNTSFALGYSHNFDAVCNVDNRDLPPLEREALQSSKNCFTKTAGLAEESLAIDAYQGSWTQVLTRILLFQLTAGLEVLDGFQSNPYRRVRLFGGAAEAQEAEPRLRQRVAIQGRIRLALPGWRAALGASGRFYWDTWGIRSGTAEIEFDKYLGEKLLLRLRGRFYQQGRAIFYRDAGEMLSYETVGPVGQYFTGDRELSPFRNWLVGAKLSYLKSAGDKGRLARAFTDLDLNVKVDLIKYEPLTPLPPNLARMQGLINALIVQVGLTLRF